MLERANPRYRNRMKSTLAWIIASVALCAALPSCGDDDAANCNVADACLEQCAERCAPEPVNGIGCLGNICECFCGSGGSGGMSGAGGADGQ